MRNRAKYKAVLECPAELKPYVMTLFRAVQTAEEVNAVTTLLEAARRREQRRGSDEVTDHARRKLIGARLPREQVARYEEHARARRLSVYAWVSQAIEKQYRAETAHRRGTPAHRPGAPWCIPPGWGVVGRLGRLRRATLRGTGAIFLKLSIKIGATLCHIKSRLSLLAVPRTW